MKIQLTPENADRLCDEFGDYPVREILLEMENWTKIQTKKNVYLTARKWLSNNRAKTPTNGNKQTPWKIFEAWDH